MVSGLPTGAETFLDLVEQGGTVVSTASKAHWTITPRDPQWYYTENYYGAGATGTDQRQLGPGKFIAAWETTPGSDSTLGYFLYQFVVEFQGMSQVDAGSSLLRSLNPPKPISEENRDLLEKGERKSDQ